MPEPMLVPDGNVVELTLIAVYAEHQHKGYASRALKMLTTLCDQNGITITLTSRGLDEAALSAVAPGCLRLS
jgi:GNAT superfamily N-acetyltransferase